MAEQANLAPKQGYAPCSFGLISRISNHPAVFFSHNKPANSAFNTINQRNEQADGSARGKAKEVEAGYEGGRHGTTT
jgi:hypothetical protein